jgi:hypothetical protein
MTPIQGHATPWLRIWLVAVVVLVVSIGSLEAFWRSQGLRPSVPDTVDLWRFWRTRVYEPRGNVLVFLGTSRVRSDVDTETLARSLPAFRSVQLGVNGDRGPIGTLRSLALDPGFRGIVICELAAPFLERSRWDDQRGYFLQPLNSQSLERLAYAYLRGQAVAFHPRVTIAALARQILSTDASRPPWQLRICFDRSFHYTSAAGEPLDDGHQLAWRKPADPRSLIEGLAALRDSVQRIQARRGRVAFVGLPASTPIFGTDKSRFTNSGFTNGITWSRVAEFTGAVCIPLERGDSLGPFHCFDSLHLDQTQAKRFTECLIAELRRNRVLE